MAYKPRAQDKHYHTTEQREYRSAWNKKDYARKKAARGEEFLKQRREYQKALYAKAKTDPEKLQKYKTRSRASALKWRLQRKTWEANIVRRARERAKAKGLPFNITQEDIVIPATCPVLGISIEVNVDYLKDTSPSLDRIKPELGYVKGNVRVISSRANRLKCDGTAAEMKLIYEDLLRIEAGG